MLCSIGTIGTEFSKSADIKVSAFDPKRTLPLNKFRSYHSVRLGTFNPDQNSQVRSFCRSADNRRSLQLSLKSVSVYRQKGELLAGPPLKNCVMSGGVQSWRDIQRSLSVRIVPRIHDFDTKEFDKCAVL